MTILTHRPRCMRKHSYTRELMRENHLLTSDLIFPIFIIKGENKRQNINSMPGIERLSVDQLLIEVAELIELGIQAIALFPVVPSIKNH